MAWQMRRSTVVGANGSSVLDEYRTSFGMFIKWVIKWVVTAQCWSAQHADTVQSQLQQW
jgi:hypothetical protein